MSRICPTSTQVALVIFVLLAATRPPTSPLTWPSQPPEAVREPDLPRNVTDVAHAPKTGPGHHRSRPLPHAASSSRGRHVRTEARPTR